MHLLTPGEIIVCALVALVLGVMAHTIAGGDQ